MKYDDVMTNSRWRTDAILKIIFLAISRRHIGRLGPNAKIGMEMNESHICRYKSRDHNDNFRKLKTADGRHFENSFISTTQP